MIRGTRNTRLQALFSSFIHEISRTRHPQLNLQRQENLRFLFDRLIGLVQGVAVVEQKPFAVGSLFYICQNNDLHVSDRSEEGS